MEPLAKNHLIEQCFLSDKCFDDLIPLPYRIVSHKHWTPLDVARTAAKFLTDGLKDAHILDIGAGIGKFCAAAAYFTHARVTGIEQREHLVSAGNKIIDSLGIQNAQIIQGNVAKCDISKYSGIYFFNSFYENIDQTSTQIDSSVECSSSLYRFYTDMLYKKLNDLPVYTRLATYHTIISNIPDNYTAVESHFAGQLKLWVKYE
jgi:16S rRNA A1518/A1519 N6-dimethyltransferase RsmA/KsgA/DIM1 with predicted DNA glycosylase/AP lyase activity